MLQFESVGIGGFRVFEFGFGGSGLGINEWEPVALLAAIGHELKLP